MTTARVWVLLCSRTGANNQALALAKALGLSFEAKRLSHNRLRRAAPYMGASLLSLKMKSRSALIPPWPDIVIAVARANVPVARWIKQQNHGHTKTVFLGNPRVDPKYLDLVVTTRDYLAPRGDNVLVLPLPMALPRAAPSKGTEPDWYSGLPKPRTLFLIGGPIRHWSLTQCSVAQTVEQLSMKSNARGGSLIVSASPRTPDDLLVHARIGLARAERGRMAPSRTGGIDELIRFSDEIIVTGDSMAMVTEAILSGKPVGVIPLELSDAGVRKLGRIAAPEGSRSRARDLRRFWEDLWSQGIVGTLDAPRAAKIEAPATVAAQALLSFLGMTPQPSRELDRGRQSFHQNPR